MHGEAAIAVDLDVIKQGDQIAALRGAGIGIGIAVEIPFDRRRAAVSINPRIEIRRRRRDLYRPSRSLRQKRAYDAPPACSSTAPHPIR